LQAFASRELTHRALIRKRLRMGRLLFWLTSCTNMVKPPDCQNSRRSNQPIDTNNVFLISRASEVGWRGPTAARQHPSTQCSRWRERCLSITCSNAVG
jgi:hypothetical protein